MPTGLRSGSKSSWVVSGRRAAKGSTPHLDPHEVASKAVRKPRSTAARRSEDQAKAGSCSPTPSRSHCPSRRQSHHQYPRTHQSRRWEGGRYSPIRRKTTPATLTHLPNSRGSPTMAHGSRLQSHYSCHVPSLYPGRPLPHQRSHRPTQLQTAPGRSHPPPRARWPGTLGS